MAFPHIAILGVGLLGGSLGLAAKSKWPDVRVTGYGHRKSTLDVACEIGAIDAGHEDVAAAVRGADLVVLCTPVGLFSSLLREIAPHLKHGAIVTDVGSTKRSIVTTAEATLPAHARFVGSHPMAGSEKRGVEFARTELFAGAVCILTPSALTDPVALALVEQFWRDLRMRTTRLSPDDHDRLLADVSHLPHAVAAALIAIQDDRALALCGKGFLDTTRIGGGDGGLWRDIFIDNREHLVASVGKLRGQLDHLLGLLDGDGAALAVWLDAAAARREAQVLQKLREVTPD